jgi:hypothetical protein
MNEHAYSGTRADSVERRRLAELVDALERDLAGGDWAPEPLERSLARRLLLACAGDGVLTAPRIRDTLWEGSMSLVHTNGGRLANLLAALFAVVEAAGSDNAPEVGGPTTPGFALLEWVADPEHAGPAWR